MNLSPAHRERALRLRDLGRKHQRRITGRVAHRGNTVHCPCCGSSFDEFGPQIHPNRFCWECGSGERHRELWLYLDRNPDMLKPGMRVLHVAPEEALLPRFQNDPSIDYVAGDFEQRFGNVRIDVTDLQFPDASFDAVMCNHVLEHVPDDRQAMREIRRVLKDDGWAILMIPSVLRDDTYEDATITTRAGRQAAFGQTDHVRIYGWDYLDRLAESGFQVEAFKPEGTWPATDIDRYRLRAPDGVDPIFIARPAG